MVKSQKNGKNTKLKKMIKVSKYEFASESAAQAAIDSLPHIEVEGENVPNHKHTIVKLGNIVIEQGEYDESDRDWETINSCLCC